MEKKYIIVGEREKSYSITADAASPEELLKAGYMTEAAAATEGKYVYNARVRDVQFDVSTDSIVVDIMFTDTLLRKFNAYRLHVGGGPSATSMKEMAAQLDRLFSSFFLMEK